MDAIKKEAIIVGAISAVSFASGAVLSFFYTRKKLRLEYDVVMEREIANAREFYKVRYKKDEYATPEAAAQNLIQPSVKEAAEALAKYQGKIEEPELPSVEDAVEEVKSVFDEISSVDREFDLDEEMKHRDEGEPYVVEIDDYMRNDAEHDQDTFTYFEGDDVLVNSEDKPVDDVDRLVGDANLQKFGYGSKDHNIVYVRNERLRMDFEIVRSRNKYAEEVLGFVEHSDGRPKIRKFRGDDE